MAPLDIWVNYPTYKDESKMNYYLDQMKNAGVDGIMVDVWWGFVETSNKVYNFDGYANYFEKITSRGMKIVPVMSFHQCGGNVGDSCDIKLPSFVYSSSEAPFFKDQDGRVDKEYISFAYDNVAISSAGGRTPLQMYSDFFTAFKNKFSDLLTSGDIAEIEVGTGPCGECRYPSYQQSQGWSYPGCGSFQSYDDKFVAQLKEEAVAAGHSEYAHNPYNVGSFNAKPGETQFWQDGADGSWNSDYGQWFIRWYASVLNTHTGNVLGLARKVFTSTRLSTKIAGIHWWYMYSCHCAETTAGFNNFINYDGYRDLIAQFKAHKVDVCFTCLEMNPDGSAGSNPPYLVQQILTDAGVYGLDFEGENALAVYDWDNYNRILAWVPKGLTAFTYLRMDDTLMQDGNYNNFKSFVSSMHNA
jgi:beta-amylase